MPELLSTGNVHATAAGGNVRLDVDPLIVALVAEHGQESGSNANGSWIRFANGLQVAWYQSGTPTPTNTQTVAPYWNSSTVALTSNGLMIALEVA